MTNVSDFFFFFKMSNFRKTSAIAAKSHKKQQQKNICLAKRPEMVQITAFLAVSIYI